MKATPRSTLSKRRRREVHGGDTQLHDARSCVGRHGSRIFLARVDDGPHAGLLQRRDVAGQRQCTHQHRVVNLVPPMSHTQHAAEQEVPAQRGQEQDPRDQTLPEQVLRVGHGFIDDVSQDVNARRNPGRWQSPVNDRTDRRWRRATAAAAWAACGCPTTPAVSTSPGSWPHPRCRPNTGDRRAHCGNASPNSSPRSTSRGCSTTCSSIVRVASNSIGRIRRAMICVSLRDPCGRMYGARMRAQFRVGQSGTIGCRIAIEPVSGLTAQSTQFDELRQDGGERDAARERFPQRATRPHRRVHANHVEHFKRTEFHAERPAGTVDGRQVDALTDHFQRLVQVGQQQSIDEETGTVADDNRELVDANHVGDQGGDVSPRWSGRPARSPPTAAPVGGLQKCSPQKSARIRHGGGQFGETNRGRVRGDQGVAGRGGEPVAGKRAVSVRGSPPRIRSAGRNRANCPAPGIPGPSGRDGQRSQSGKTRRAARDGLCRSASGDAS